MDYEKTPQSNDDPQGISTSPRNLHTPFAWGVAGWFVGMVILFILSWTVVRPETISIAAIWTISYGWAAYLLGLVAVMVCGIKSRIPLRPSLLAYLVPAIVLALLGVLCLLIYPDALFREDLLVFLPITWVFYLFGLLWTMFARNASSGLPIIPRLLMPALVGGLVIFGSVAIPAFASDAFRYRDAFLFTLDKRTSEDKSIIAEGTLEIRKAGDYLFSAPRYMFEEIADDPEGSPPIKEGVITWGASGKPNAGAIGTFPLKIVWPQTPSPTSPGEPGFEEQMTIEVRDRSRGDRLVYSIYASAEP